MKIMSELDLEKLHFTDIYQGKTIRNIVEIYDEKRKNELSEVEKEKIGRTIEYPISDKVKTSLVSSQIGYIGLDIVACKKFTKEFDLSKFCDIFNKYAKNTSMFSTIVTKNDNGEYVIKYVNELYKPISIEKMSENEFIKIKDELLKPLDVIEKPLYRIRIIETEKNGYFFFQCCHALIDGQGAKNMYDDLMRLYIGKKVENTNNYFAILYDENTEKEKKYIDICKEYIDKNYTAYLEKSITILPDDNKFKSKKSIVKKYDTGININIINKSIDYYKVSRTILFEAAVHLSLSKLTNENNFLIAYMVSNRIGNKNCAGVLTNGLCSKIDMNNCNNIENMLEILKKENSDNLSYSISLSSGDIEMIIISDLDDMKDTIPEIQKYVSDFEIDRPYDKLDEPVKMQILSTYNQNDKLFVEFKCDTYYLTEEKQELFIKTFIYYLNKIVNFDKDIFDDIKNILRE